MKLKNKSTIGYPNKLIHWYNLFIKTFQHGKPVCNIAFIMIYWITNAFPFWRLVQSLLYMLLLLCFASVDNKLAHKVYVRILNCFPEICMYTTVILCMTRCILKFILFYCTHVGCSSSKNRTLVVIISPLGRFSVWNCIILSIVCF